MSVRDQERREKEVERRIDERMCMADKRVRGGILARQKAADLRADEVVRRIERGDVDPRPLPSLREDSMASMESMPSMESSPSIESIESSEPVSGVTGEAQPSGVHEDMPLEGIAPYDPASAEENLAQRVTEDTDAGGDPHLHAERKVEQMGKKMFEE